MTNTGSNPRGMGLGLPAERANAWGAMSLTVCQRRARVLPSW